MKTENKDRQVPIRFAANDLARLDELRRVEQDLPSRAEMVRRLIERAYNQAAGLDHANDQHAAAG